MKINEPDFGMDGALIGVCGVQGSGKSVFLTCVFQTVDLAAPLKGGLTFDREKVGGARYFRNLEEEIRSKGSLSGTRERIRARLYFKVDDPNSRFYGNQLSVDLVDFAGKFFELSEDLGPSLSSSDLPEADKLEAHEISDFLQRCDGLIILISAKLFRRSNWPSLGDNPFPSSVNYLIEDCREKRRPLAVVISQADSTPELTREKLEAIERIKRFRSQFTSSVPESLRGNALPYGTVELIACYELGPEGLPVTQGSGETIWRSEASKIFLQILAAAWPRISTKLSSRQKASRARLRNRLIGGAIGLLLVLAAVVFGVHWSRHQEYSQEVSLVRQIAEQVRQTSPVTIQQLGQLQQLADEPSGEPMGEELAEAFKVLWADLETLTNQILAAPALDEEQARKLALLGQFEPLRGHRGSEWWTPAISEIISARLTCIGHLKAAESSPVKKIKIFEEQKQKFKELGDQAFRGLLDTSASELKTFQIDTSARAALGLKSTVRERIQAIRELVFDQQQPGDSEYRLLLRKRLARELVKTLFELEENPQIRNLLSGPIPDLKEVRPGSLRLDLVLREIRKLEAPWIPSLEPFSQAVQDRQFIVESILDDLFKGLSYEERSALWQEMIAEMEVCYIFDLSAEAAVPDVHPLPHLLKSVLTASTFLAQGQQEAKAIFLSSFGYAAELLEIERHSAAAALGG